MTCKDIIIAKLKELGADGLCCEDCGCGLDDLCPCGEDCLDCVPAKKEIIGEIIYDFKTKRSHCDVKETRFVPLDNTEKHHEINQVNAVNRVTITQITSDCKGDDYKSGTVEYRYNIGDAICIGKADYLTIIDIGKIRMIMLCPSTNPTENDHKALCLAGKIIQYAKDNVLWVSNVIGLGMTFGDDNLITRI